MELIWNGVLTPSTKTKFFFDLEAAAGAALAERPRIMVAGAFMTCLVVDNILKLFREIVLWTFPEIAQKIVNKMKAETWSKTKSSLVEKMCQIEFITESSPRYFFFIWKIPIEF